MPIIPPIWRTRPATPEQALAAATLTQAFTDMFGGAASQSETRDTVDTIATASMRYLTDRHGHLAQWRNKWCDFLDLDGDVLAIRVRAILDGQVDLPGEPRLAFARARWARIAQKPTASEGHQRLPTIKPKPAPPATIAPPVLIDPSEINMSIPDDPFFVACAGHLRASRRWQDGEVSRFLGPLPSLHAKIGQALWEITQVTRVGRHTLTYLGDPDQVVADLRTAFPNCDVIWTSKGHRLPAYQSKAGLRLYLKELARAA